MSMTERLTKRHPNGVVGISECRYYNFDDFQKLAKKLADYEDIGTVSEFQQLKEKATAKKPIETEEFTEGGWIGKCPSCGLDCNDAMNYCDQCGQKLLWD